MERLYVIVDGSLPAGAQAAQAGHAVAEFWALHTEAARAWKEGPNNLVILAAPDRAALYELLGELGGDPLAVAVYEPDLGDELTAIATGPSVRPLVSSLPLALKHHHPARECAAPRR